ncbi:zinc finger CCCH domain-containing protein 5 [Dorcoceras hygrometricum]|uniref:Zinc finger CCCH domain-containing protein 5 n=1 Tax=Dorcoceras hygrometricum TaxID=472368 RepID=A0A2Z7BJQ5_9LAMI|nr:zinc finger CCCH domain-containing protein 5 [Dorcoceras hygrometricum]
MSKSHMLLFILGMLMLFVITMSIEQTGRKVLQITIDEPDPDKPDCIGSSGEPIKNCRTLPLPEVSELDWVEDNQPVKNCGSPSKPEHH